MATPDKAVIGELRAAFAKLLGNSTRQRAEAESVLDENARMVDELRKSRPWRRHPEPPEPE